MNEEVFILSEGDKMTSPNGDPGQQSGEQTAIAEATAVQPALIQRAGGAVLHFFTKQIHAEPSPGMSEHFGHSSKRNDLTTQAYVPPRRLSGRH